MKNKIKLLEKNINVFGINDENFEKDDLPQEIALSSPKQRYVDRFNKIIPDMSDLSKNQCQFLIESFNSLEMVASSIAPLNSLGITYSLALAGGATRDFILRNADDINDLDVYLFLDNKNIDDYSRVSKVKNGFSLTEKDCYSLLGENVVLNKDEDFADYSVSKLISKKFNIQNKYFKKHVSRIYLEDAIKSIFKLSNKKNTSNSMVENTDLILTHQPIRDFITFFDFEICKTYFDFRPNNFNNIDESLKTDIGFLDRLKKFSDEEKIQYMYDSLCISPSCLKDMSEKTLSINTSKFPTEHIDYFLKKHYLKLVEKFPEYDFNIPAYKVNDPDKKVAIYETTAKARALRLEKLLSIESNPVVKKHKL